MWRCWNGRAVTVDRSHLTFSQAILLHSLGLFCDDSLHDAIVFWTVIEGSSMAELHVTQLAAAPVSWYWCPSYITPTIIDVAHASVDILHKVIVISKRDCCEKERKWQYLLVTNEELQDDWLTCFENQLNALK